MLIDVVKPYCLRWRDICFVLPLSGHYQLKTSTFPCLERLTLSVASGYPSDARKDPVIIRDAPLLRQVTLFFILSLQVNLPMEQLTILDFTYMYIPQVIALLRRCPNLADLTCRLVRRGDYDDEPPPVELHALRRLNIPNETLLVYLTAPHLERLQIRRMSDSVQVATSALHELISRSSCALKFLAIPFGGIPAAQIKYLFGSTNTIEHLQLSFEYSLEAPRMLLQALCSVDVLPRLRRLEIHDDDPMKGERARSLLDLLAWRRTHAALESFELVVSTGKLDDVPPATIMAEFRALGEAGLHVRVTIPQPDYSTPSVVLLDTLQPGS
jgi:hypothetical protein